MNEAPLNVLVGFVVPLLKGDAALSEMIGARVYDRVPASAKMPYISFGASWETTDDAECIAGVEIGFRIDVWSTEVGRPEARRIAHRVRALLHDLDADLPEGALVMLQHRRSDTLTGPDGLTSQVAIEFSATIET